MIAAGAVRTTLELAGSAATATARAVEPAYTAVRLLRPSNPGQSPQGQAVDDAARA